MRKLTVEEVEKEVRDIETRTWPLAHTLPVKNLYDGRFGAILRDGGPETIRPHVVPGKFVGGAMGEVTAYPSLKAMVEAGWVVD